MTQQSKILEEKEVMNLFQKSFPDFPKGKLKKSESPDFILQITPKKSIGIELTKLYNHKAIDQNYSLEQIKWLIHKKEEKIKLYRKKKINIIWLIITIDSENTININRLNCQLEKLFFTSLFQKVFLFETKDNKIIELVNSE
ncbi:MAG: hypothetical protein GXO79_09680 [Chlorobi bacterium]|nr:hypothetical protein [Chlorobiota bacterium]